MPGIFKVSCKRALPSSGEFVLGLGADL